MNIQLNYVRNAGQPGALTKQISFIFLFLITICNFSFAESRGSSLLELSIWNNQAFEVLINNRTYKGHQIVRIEDLRPGNYAIQVRQRAQNSYGQGGGGVRNLYQGRIEIPRGRRLKAEVNRNRRLHIQLSVPHPMRPILQPVCNHSTPHCAHGHVNGHGQNQSRSVCGTSNEFYPTDSWGVSDENWPTNDPYGCPSSQLDISSAILSAYELNALLAQLEDSFFDDQRMIIARQAIVQRSITSFQAKEILERFNFESTRLEFAKFAFLRVEDPQRFYQVNEVFSFGSSIRELDQYIASF